MFLKAVKGGNKTWVNVYLSSDSTSFFFFLHLALCEKYGHLIIFYLYCGVFDLLYVDRLSK